MIWTCIREHANRVDKYLFTQVLADELEGSQGYRFTDMDDVRELVKISGVEMQIILDCRRGCVYLARTTPTSAPKYTSVALPGEILLLDMATREIKAVSRMHFRMNYRVLDKI
jgi:hypothetical protein